MMSLRTCSIVLLLGLLCCLNLSCLHAAPNKLPNIVFILTDDQDVVLGSLDYMPKTRKYLQETGITFSNAYTTNPVCCPSRASILTGKYPHNHGTTSNQDGCGNLQWVSNMEPYSFSAYLKNRTYNTFYAGKYLNKYGVEEFGGYQHVPRGWDEWHGMLGNSHFYNYAISVNGEKESHGNETEDYLTDLINKRALKFIGEQSDSNAPFLAVLSVPAAHTPFTPSPKYLNTFKNSKAPRTKSFNKHGTNKHWLVEHAYTPMDPEIIESIDEIHGDRLATLLSVDDMVEDIVNKLEEKNLLDNTYIFYTSDHGFHLGQFSLPSDKRQPYEFDIRIPFVVRGPGIKSNQIRKEAILNIDVAPTFLEIAGIKVPGDMDGESFLSLLHSDESTEQHGWRTEFMVEYWGEYNIQEIAGACSYLSYEPVTMCNGQCTCSDSKNNTYSCVVSPGKLKYCKFVDDVGKVELYDLEKDPDELDNLENTIDAATKLELENRRKKLMKCHGRSCHRSKPPVSIKNTLKTA